LLRLAGHPDNGDGYAEYQPTGVAAAHCNGAQSAPISGNLTFYTTDGSYLTAQINTATCSASFPSGASVVRLK